MRETELIARYLAPLATRAGAAGLRDDVAVLSGADGVTIATCDALVEGLHFLPDDPMDTVARKLVAVNASDALAKGARPMEALLALGWPDARGEEKFAAFCRGLGDALERVGAALVGGDTVMQDGALFCSLTLTGRAGPRGPIRGGGGAPGDELWVTGVIGAGVLGLEAARRGEAGWPASAYREPLLPPLGAADLVAAHATASIDVSDGLLGDAVALAEASGVGLEIDFDAVPWAASTADVAERMKLASGGDDYQILFAAKPDARGAVQAWSKRGGVPIHRIGSLRAEGGLSVFSNGEAVRAPSTLRFEHRAKR